LELFGYDCHYEIHVHMYGYMPNGLLYMRDMIHKWWMMGVVVTWHVKWMSGLELKEHGVDMRWGPRLMGWWWSEVWIQNVIRMRN